MEGVVPFFFLGPIPAAFVALQPFVAQDYLRPHNLQDCSPLVLVRRGCEG